MVSPELPELLTRAFHALGGALAIVSGRKLPELRNFLAPASVPMAAEHGALLSFGQDDIEWSQSWPQTWNTPLQELAEHHPGTLIERKATGVAIHFRKAPEAEKPALELAHKLARFHPEEFEVMESKMVAELKRRGASKGRAIEQLMALEPFCGRVPVFVADDQSDAIGFSAVEAMGGTALHVDVAFGGRTSAVRDWLRQFGDLA